MYTIQTQEFVDEYEPLEEGLDKVTEVRKISSLKAVLTINKADELVGKPGYMTPLEGEQVNEDKFKRDIENYNRRKQGKKIEINCT